MQTHDKSLVGPFDRKKRAVLYEAPALADVLTGLRDDPIMVDIGAHLGSSLLPFAKERWHIYAYEPDLNNFEGLKKATAPYSSVTLFKLAVSDEITELPFYATDDSTGASSLLSFTSKHYQQGEVSTTTVSHLIEVNQLDHIDFLKIDTEGWELKVLQGVPWQQYKPLAIMCEFEDSKTRQLGYDMNTLAQYLIDKGYTILVSEWHPVIRYGIPHDWRRLVPYPCQLGAPDAWGNLIAFQDAELAERLSVVAQQHIGHRGFLARRALNRLRKMFRT